MSHTCRHIPEAAQIRGSPDCRLSLVAMTNSSGCVSGGCLEASISRLLPASASFR